MRKLASVLLAVGLVLAGILLALVLPRHCPVNRAACERIEHGMTQVQVEAVLGVPPGDYKTRPSRRYIKLWESGWWMRCGKVGTWVGDDAELDVGFDGGVVVLINLTPVEPADVGPVALATWRLKRLMERWLP